MIFPDLDPSKVAIVARDIAGSLAVASIAFGAWLIYSPAGFIVGGLLILSGVVLSARQATE